MNDNRLGGTLLVAGNAAGLLTMAIHPVAGRGLLPPDGMQRLATFDRAVHGLALVGVVLAFLGALALTRRLSAGAGRLALAAMVVYGFATVAILVAGAMDGFVAADLLGRLVEGDPKLESYRLLLDYTFRVNQAFAAVYVVGACAAVALWSAAAVRTRAWPAGLGIYGLVPGPVIVAALFSGHLTLGVHGFGLVVLAQAGWFLVAGGLLWRDGGPAGPAPSRSSTAPDA